ncbi:MAG: hypothetical protein IT318_24790 [Anaerolineales bacterium]|nr:hypothetical protein [Anaerolineales bacterium]
MEAVINLARQDADLNALVEQRIAARHKFGVKGATGWPVPSAALQLRYDGGGTPDTYTRRSRLRLEARCYGESQAAAFQVYARLIALTRRSTRVLAETGGVAALIDYLLPDSGPSFIQDPAAGVDAVLVFLKTAVAEQAAA